MRVDVLYFASFREATQRDREPRELPEGTSVTDLWVLLQNDFPFFRLFRSAPAAAVNREHVPAATPLSDGDEVAFLPPVAGG